MKFFLELLLLGFLFVMAGFVYLFQWVKNPTMNKLASCNRCGKQPNEWPFCKRCGKQYQQRRREFLARQIKHIQ